MLYGVTVGSSSVAARAIAGRSIALPTKPSTPTAIHDKTGEDM
jgi:hypothetical protein